MILIDSNSKFRFYLLISAFNFTACKYLKYRAAWTWDYFFYLEIFLEIPLHKKINI